MSQSRLIAHLDLDSFFVSVEVLKDPSLKGKPVIVGGKDRGVVAACSYEARAFGIHSAMPSSKAKQLCPQAIFVSGSYSDYSKYSRWVTDIIAAKAPLFEKASIDEFYLDLSGMDKFFDPLKWITDLRNEIIDKTQLPISFGLASNKMLAKMATNSAKPNGFLFIPPGKERDFLATLPVAAIPGVGDQTENVLKSMGIFRISQIEKTGKEMLEQVFGKWGADLWDKSQGIHSGEVTPFHIAKSISTENTFGENISDTLLIEKEIIRQTEKICHELRKDGKVAGCVAIKVRYPDFHTFTRQTTIPYTNADDDIFPVVKKLFEKYHKPRTAVRLFGIRLSDLTNDAMQPTLFNDTEKRSDLYKAIDEVKNRFGKTFIKRASSG